MSKEMVKFEIKTSDSEYFECVIVGYNNADIGIFSGGFATYKEAFDFIEKNIKK